MSQIFAKDAQFNSAAPNIAASGFTALISTNALPHPYTTCKMVIRAFVQCIPDAATTRLNLTIVRNPAAEALNIGTFGVTLVAGASITRQIVGFATDNLPDGRDAIYQVSVSQIAGGNPATAVQAFIEAEAISG